MMETKYPRREIYHDFEFPDQAMELIMGNGNTCPEVYYMDRLENPFQIIQYLIETQTNEGPDFWQALMAKYIEEDHDPSQVSDIDILILRSKFGV